MHGLENRIIEKQRFIIELGSLTVDALEISDYNKIYLKKHLKSLTYSVNLAWQILDLGLKNLDKPTDKICLVEIGGGTGIISLLAKWLGFGKVIYTDTFRPSCDDFKIISSTLNLEPETIVCGGIDELAGLNMKNIDLIVSRDVIEHIYNPGSFFKKSAFFYNKAVMVHNTSANIYNIFRKKYFRQIHEKDEGEGNPNQFKPGDSTESFYKMRLDFIRQYFPEIDNSRAEFLAALTRGKIYEDIKTEVERYLKTQRLPKLPNLKTNTCDPQNGNWTEHLLTIEEYESFIDKSTYLVQWHFCSYDVWQNKGVKKVIIRILNQAIKKTGKLAKYISPAIILVAVPRSN